MTINIIFPKPSPNNVSNTPFINPPTTPPPARPIKPKKRMPIVPFGVFAIGSIILNLMAAQTLKAMTINQTPKPTSESIIAITEVNKVPMIPGGVLSHTL